MHKSVQYHHLALLAFSEHKVYLSEVILNFVVYLKAVGTCWINQFQECYVNKRSWLEVRDEVRLPTPFVYV